MVYRPGFSDERLSGENGSAGIPFVVAFGLAETFCWRPNRCSALFMTLALCLRLGPQLLVVQQMHFGGAIAESASMLLVYITALSGLSL